MQAIDDKELMARACRNGDTRAFAELVGRWDQRVLAYLTKATRSRESARDLRQEVFLRIYRYRTTYKPDYAFSTWLFRITGNVLATWHKQQNRVRAFESHGEADAADEAPNPGERAQIAEHGDAVREAIGNLTVAEREILLQRFDLGLRYREMAEIHGMPEATLKSRLYAVLARLRRSLGNGTLSERNMTQ